MPWAKIDDRFWRHRKTRKAWREPRAIGLFILALSYASELRENGWIDNEWVEDQLPSAPERKKVVDKLLEVGLFENFNGGYMIHDFLDYNPSSDQLDAISEAKRLAGRKGGIAKANRWQGAKQTPSTVLDECQANGQQDAGTTPSKIVARTPTHTHNPNTPLGERGKKHLTRRSELRRVDPAAALRRTAEELAQHPALEGGTA